MSTTEEIDVTEVRGTTTTFMKIKVKHSKKSNYRKAKVSNHSCMDNAVPYISDGLLGHGFECGICGKFLQAG